MTSFIKTPLSQIKGTNQLHAVVIGGTGGLGRTITQELAAAGAKVTVVGRTFRDQDNQNIDFIKADLESIGASQELASKLDVSNTDLVLFTTGIFSSRQREETQEGIERDLSTSYLNRLAILDIIGDKLKHESSTLGKPRVFIMGFPGNHQLGTIDDLNQEKKYGFYAAHMNTVAGNEAIVLDFSKKYSNFNIYGLNPGLVKTGIRDNLFGTGIIARTFEHFMGWFNATPEQYASTITPALLSPDLKNLTGVHIDKKGSLLAHSKGFSFNYAQDYITKSRELLKSKGF